MGGRAGAPRMQLDMYTRAAVSASQDRVKKFAQLASDPKNLLEANVAPPEFLLRPDFAARRAVV